MGKNIKFILIALLIIFFIAIGLRTYNQIDSNYKNNATPSPTLQPTNTSQTKQDLLEATIYGEHTFSEEEYAVKIITYSNETSLSNNIYNNLWIIQNDDMQLTTNTFIDESPFSSDNNLEIRSIPDTKIPGPIYRIPLGVDQYFYTNDYRNDCGNLHCSHGSITLVNSESIDILCQVQNNKGVDICDELMKNLEIVDIKDIDT